MASVGLYLWRDTATATATLITIAIGPTLNNPRTISFDAIASPNPATYAVRTVKLLCSLFFLSPCQKIVAVWVTLLSAVDSWSSNQALHASVGRFGEPCFGTRFSRRSHLRLHPDLVHAVDVPPGGRVD